MNEPVGLNKIFQSAAQIYKTNFKLYISVSLLFALTTVSVSKLLGVESNEDPQAFIYLIISTLISSWFSIALLFASVFFLTGKKITFKQCLRLPRERYMNYLIVNAVLIVMVMCGFFLLVIPGIYFAVVYNFASTITVLEKTDFKESFVRSNMLVKGYFFNILGFFAIVTMLVLMPEVITAPLKAANPSLGLAVSRSIATFIVPLVMIAQVALYLRMKELKTRQIY